MAKELWKDIRGYEGFYQISNRGRIRSIAVRRYLGKYQRMEIIKREKIMTPTDNGHGYLVVHLKANNNRKVSYIHRLVAEHFIDNPENKPEVNHKDYNRHNNDVNNLEWVSRQENVNYSIERTRQGIKKRWERYRANCAISNTTS